MKEKPKIMYLLPSEGFGGAERQGSLHISSLPQHGIDVVPVVGPGQRILQVLAERGVSQPHWCESIPGEFARPYSPLAHTRYVTETIAAWRRTLAELSRLGQRENVDLVFASRTVGWTLAGPLARRLRIPGVWRAGSRAHGWLRRAALREFSRFYRPDVMVANCNAVAESVAALIGAPTHLVPNGVDTHRFDPRTAEPTLRNDLALASGVFTCGLAARPSPDKGMVFLADVMDRVLLSNPNGRVRFLVAGEFGWRRQIEQFFAERGLKEQVIFLGHVQDVASFYASCDVAILTSRERSIEGSPNALLEAMAMERPVVATSVGGIPELIAHGSNGLLAPPDDPIAFASHLQDLLRQPRLRHELGKAARRTVSTGFSERVATEQLAALIRSVLAASSSSRTIGQRPGDSLQKGLARPDTSPPRTLAVE